MDNVFGLEELWVIKETNSYFNPQGCEVFTDYDEAIFRCEAMEHKAIIDWQSKNKKDWEFSYRLYKVITLKEAFDDVVDGEQESSYDDGYSQGRTEGYDEGYDEGYENGKKDASY